MESKQPYVDEFFDYMKMIKDSSDKTIINYKNDLKVFFDFTEGEFNVNKSKIDAFTAYLINERKESRSTVNRRLSALKSYYNFLINDEIINRAPKIKFLKLNQSPIIEVMSQKEIFKILDNIDDLRDRALLETLYATGAREFEISNLNIENIYFEEKLIHIVNGKRKKARIVPISKEAIKWIKAYIGSRKSGPVFLNNKKTRLQTRGIYNICMKYFNIAPHQLRHAFATHMIQKTGNVKGVSEMLGHSNIRTTERYTHLSKGEFLSDIYEGGMDR